MKILEVSRYKKNFVDHQLPFVTEQGRSLQAAGCEVEYFLIQGNYLRAVRMLKKKIREVQPDIVHAHFGLSCVTAELQSLCPVVSTFHNGEWHNWWVNLLSSLMALRAKHLVYVAPHIRDKMFFKHPHYTILPCGVSMDDFKPMDYEEARRVLSFDTDKKYILFGGAFSNERKNYTLLKEAIERMKDDGLRNKIKVIEMKGMDRNMVAMYMSACDLFVLPTKNEGSPQALKEAMACNCPIVATDCADIAYLMGNLNGHYLLSNKGNSKAKWVGDESSVAELELKVEEALHLPSGYRTEGRKRIVELGYTNKLIAEKLIGIYTQVVRS